MYRKSIGGNPEDEQSAVITTEEVRLHNKPGDQWLLINGRVYDITSFAKRHPGGAKVISHFAGEDATVRYCRIYFAIF